MTPSSSSLATSGMATLATWPRRASSGPSSVNAIVERLSGRNRLGQLSQVLELAYAPPRLLVQTGVLDRAGQERRARDEELDFVLGELARRRGVHRDDADQPAVLAEAT